MLATSSAAIAQAGAYAMGASAMLADDVITIFSPRHDPPVRREPSTMSARHRRRRHIRGDHPRVPDYFGHTARRPAQAIPKSGPPKTTYASDADEPPPPRRAGMRRAMPAPRAVNDDDD